MAIIRGLLRNGPNAGQLTARFRTEVGKAAVINGGATVRCSSD